MPCTSCLLIVLVVGIFTGWFYLQDPDRFRNYIEIAKARGNYGGHRGTIDRERANQRRLAGMDPIHRVLHRVRDAISSVWSMARGG